MKQTILFSILISIALIFSNCNKTPMAIEYKGVYYDLATGLNEEGTQLYDRRDNNIYKVAKIGNQTWMAENVRYKFSNGHPGNNENQICPLGWHMPLKDEWKEMINYLNRIMLLLRSNQILPGTAPIVVVLMQFQ